MNSTKIKYALLQHFGFKKGYFVCTEFGYSAGIADVFCINKHFEKQDIIDIEVKISKSDFLNDFKHKEFKHQMFKNMIDKKISLELYPNRFYFCVPDYLVEFVLQYLKDNKLDYYGLIEYREIYTGIIKEGKHSSILDEDGLLKTIKPAKKMMKEIDEVSYIKLKDFMLNRLRNDNIGFYKTLAWNVNRYEKIYEEEKC